MKIRYKVIIFLLIFNIFIYLGVLYVNRTFIPVKLKALLAKKITQQIDKEVDIERLRFSIAKGFVLNGVKIYQGPKENGKFLFKADEVSFGIVFLPSLKKHRLIIPCLSLYKPYLNLKRFQDGSCNISSLIKKEAKEKRASRLRFIVRSLTFDEGELTFDDYYGGKVFQKTVTALRGRAGFSLPNSVALSCTGKVDHSPLRITSRFSLPNQELSIELETKDLLLADYCNVYLPALPAESQLNKLRIDSGLCEGLLKIDILNFEEVKTKVNLYIQGLKVAFEELTAAGNYKLTGSAGFNIRDFTNFRYNLRLGLEKTKITTPLKSLKNIDEINGVLSLSEKRWAGKELSAILYASPAIISGVVNSPHKDFIADTEFSSTIALERIADIAGIGIEKGEASVEIKLTYKKDQSYHISGKSEIKDLKLNQKEVSISGDFLISGESSGIGGDLQSLEYKGEMSFTKVNLEGVGVLPFISDAAGEATFSTRQITIKRLIGVCADAKIALGGEIDYLGKEPNIALALKTDNLSLSKFISTLPLEVRTKFKDMEVEGICSLNLSLSGTVGKPETFGYEGGLLLKQGSLAIPYWPNNLSNIDCQISFKRQQISWEELNFDIKNTPYHSYGRLVDFAAPKISLGLESKDLKLISEIKIEDKIINILKCTGKYLGTSFSAIGKISDIKTAYAYISGNVDFDLRDAAFIFKAHKETLNKLKPEGIVRLTFQVQGPLKEIKDATIYVEGGADKIYIWGLRLDDFYLDYRMQDRFIDIPSISAYPYGGIINISSRANLKTEEQPYIVNIDIKDVDLHQLIKDTGFKHKRIKGTFTARAVLNGYLDQKDSLKGKGWLQVSDGYLWEFPVMRGIMEVIFMMPPEYVTLTDAFGNFSVNSRGIYTEDFKILSKTASLLWVGSLGFDGSLDFTITGRFAEDVIKKTTQPGKIASAILREAGNLIMEIRLTGALANPKYQIVPFPVKRIFKEKVIDKFKDIFGNIFE